MLKTDGKGKNASKRGFRVAKPSVMTPQWKMFPRTSGQRSHLLDPSQGFPLCDISLRLGQLPASQHSGITSLKMAKLWLTQPGRAGKGRLERQETGRKEGPGWGRSLWGRATSSHHTSPTPTLLFAWGSTDTFRMSLCCPHGVSYRVPAAPREDKDGQGKQTLPQLPPIPYPSSHSYSVF